MSRPDAVRRYQWLMPCPECRGRGTTGPARLRGCPDCGTECEACHGTGIQQCGRCGEQDALIRVGDESLCGGCADAAEAAA